MKSASMSAPKWAERAAGAAGDFVKGAQETTKDQAQRAIAAKEVYKAALTDSFGRDSYAKGLQRSGKAGWLSGVIEKGGPNYSSGVSTSGALSKYTTNSAKYDAARASSEGMARGIKGSPQNLGKVAKVVSALIAAKKA